MGLFGSKKTEEQVSVSTSPTGRDPKKNPVFDSSAPTGKSYLCPGMVFDGTITGTVPLHVEGIVNGKMDCQTHISVGPNGKINAEINCLSIKIEGEVTGNIHALDSIQIEPSGVLKGDIWTKSFINQPGGFFEGYSHMQKEKSPSLKENEKNKK